MHYGVKYTVGIQKIRERCVVELEECTYGNETFIQLYKWL